MDYLSRLLNNLADKRKINGVNFSPNLNLTHILFADDILIFVEDRDDYVSNLKMILHLFESASGLNINLSKSTIFPINVPTDPAKSIADSWGISKGHLPTSYLGMPLGGKPSSSNFWDNVLQKIQKKLSSWKYSQLSKGGRITLINSTLESLPIYQIWKVNDGEDISFWLDNWNGNAPLSLVVPRLFALSTNKKGSVKDFWNPSSNDWHLHINRPLRDHEKNLWHNIKASLPTPLPNRGLPKPLWKLNSNNIFDTASVKKILSEAPVSPANFHPNLYKTLWKVEFPKKCKFFIWTLIHGCINTADRLQKRLPNWALSPNWCYMCNKSQEDINHLFIHCPYSQQLWSKAKALLKWNRTPTDVQSLVQNICSLNIRNQKGLITFNTSAILLWKIWLERNNRIFKQQGKDSQDLWEDILAQTGLFSCPFIRFLWISLLSFGESWHNNHHAFEYSARVGIEWWEVDIGWYVILFLQAIGLATDVKQPSQAHKQRLSMDKPNEGCQE
ncbi:LINE-1 retrotransposable element ORF2 protein [Cucumis melo var. makuwa]|nr:LINE-1 retrotransposable element ORF2 protein [Cucumis melo var. makuwa]